MKTLNRKEIEFLNSIGIDMNFLNMTSEDYDLLYEKLEDKYVRNLLNENQQISETAKRIEKIMDKIFDENHK